MTAVADENGPAAFELAGRAVEAGYDLRLLCRELSRLVRDLLVLSRSIPPRMTDADIAPESGSRAAAGAAAAVLARGPAARLRPAHAGRDRHPERGRAALPPRDGAAAVDPPPEAHAARDADGAAQRRARPRRPRGRGPARTGVQPRPRRAAVAAVRSLAVSRPAPASPAAVAKRSSATSAAAAAAAAAPPSARRRPAQRRPRRRRRPAPTASAAAGGFRARRSWRSQKDGRARTAQ